MLKDLESQDLGLESLGPRTKNGINVAHFIADTKEEGIVLITLDVQLGKRFLLEIHDTYET